MNNQKLLMSASTTMIIAATLLVPLTTTTTAAYAQQQGKACPPGFQLNKGVCQAEPGLSCDYLYEWNRPDRVRLTEDGQCEVTVATSPACVDPNAYYDIGTDMCEIAQTNDPAPNQEMHCAQYEEVGATVQDFEGYWQCVWYDYYQPEREDCTVGTLNEESGLCEVKPGRRA